MSISYETIFIVDTSVTEDLVKATVEKFKNVLETSTKLEKFDEWGNKKLAYEIDGKTEGYYVFATFDAEPSFPSELERLYKINDGVIKYMTIKKKG